MDRLTGRCAAVNPKGKVKSEDAPYNAPIILTAEDTIIWVIGTAKVYGFNSCRGDL